MRKLCLAACIALLTPAVTSHAKSLEDLLVEKGVITRGEAARASNSGASKVYWNDGTRVDFPDNGFTVGVNTLIQTRYTFWDNDSTSNDSSFEVNKARIIVSGTALHEEFNYFLQGDFVGDKSGDTRSTNLLDAYLQWNACDWASVKMGQYKVGYSRQYLSEDNKLQFADHALSTLYFNLGRNQGLGGQWNTDDGSLVVKAQIFNGLSDGEGINSDGLDTKHLGVLSVRLNPADKIDAYEEGDIGQTPGLGLSFGATYAAGSSSNKVGESGGAQDVDLNAVSVDATLKTQGFSLAGEFFWQDIDPELGDDTQPLGGYVQAGYFFEPKKWEVAGRYEFIDCDDGTAGGVCAGQDNINAVTAGLNYYWWEHNLKAQLNYSFINQDQSGADGDDTNTNRWLFQLSSYF